MSSSGIAEAAQSGFASARAYDAHRPSYPAEAVEKLLQNLGLTGVKGAKIVDLAAGTGKFTEILSRRPEEFDIVAVEPHDGMRTQLEQKQLPRLSVVKGTAGNMSEIPDQTFAAVVAAQVSLDELTLKQTSDLLSSHFIGMSGLSRVRKSIND